ncbi:hypothetical protein [Corallococcus sp. AB030]|nr:hypothetical protein [Corallococcus sp. AB030]
MDAAWFCPTFDFRRHTPDEVLLRGTRLLIEDIGTKHVDHCFCGRCGVPVYRSPTDGVRTLGGRVARLSHYPGYDHVLCAERPSKANATERGATPSGRPSFVSGPETTLVPVWLPAREAPRAMGGELGSALDHERKMVRPRVASGVARSRSSARVTVQQIADSLPSLLENPFATGGRLRDFIRPIHLIDGADDGSEPMLWWGRLHSVSHGNAMNWLNIRTRDRSPAAFWVKHSVVPKFRSAWEEDRIVLAYASFVRETKNGRPKLRWDIHDKGQIALVPEGHESCLTSM